MKDKKFYHYTHSEALKKIIASGFIKLSTASVYTKKEKPIAWVSSNENWEHTATKMIGDPHGGTRLLTFDEQQQNLGCVRVQVKNRSLKTWAKLKYDAKMDLHFAKKMESSGIQKGANPSEWYGSNYPIGSKDWITIERFENGQWLPENIDF